MGNMDDGSQLTPDGGGSPQGSDALLESAGAVSPSGSEEVGASAEHDSGAASEAGGVKPYSDDEIKNLDPTDVDWDRVDSSNYRKVYKRQQSVHSSQLQKSKEDERARNKEYSERFEKLERKLEEERSGSTGKLVEHLANEKLEAAKREQDRKEKELFDSLSDEGKVVFQYFKKQSVEQANSFKSELDSIKEKAGKGALPPEIEEKLKKVDALDENDRVAKTASVINNVINASSVDAEVKKSEKFGVLVRSYISMRWNAEKSANNGRIITPLDEATRLAIDDVMGVVSLFGPAREASATTTTPEGTPRSSAAQAAPPRVSGATTPSKPGAMTYEQSKRDYWKKFANDLGVSAGLVGDK